ncbi:hypothetical protein FRC01_013534 [Tulasnella sp. 417]|nr:hypothetical protein FRC01_013534 [Tulasnella sp. 417]
MSYYVYQQTSYLLEPALSLAAAAAMTWFVAVVARHRGAPDRRSGSAELPTPNLDAFVPRLTYAADTKSYSPGTSSQSPVISPHPASHPRALRLPVYRPIQRPTPKYPITQRSVSAMLEEVNSEKEVVGESVERTSTACPDEKSAGEEPPSEIPHDNLRPPPTPSDLVSTFGEELPDTSEGDNPSLAAYPPS